MKEFSVLFTLHFDPQFFTF
jgi:hypothetical protein